VKEETKDYLTTNVKDLLEKVVKNLLKSKPNDPVSNSSFL